MINQIKNHNILNKYLSLNCEENGVCATIDNTLTNNETAIVKVDDYYNDKIQNINPIPPAADFLVSVLCENNNYVLYIIELKNISSPNGFDVKNVYNKFKTTINDFMNYRFSAIYLNNSYNIKDLFIYFVTNPYHNKNIDDYNEKKKGTTKIDNLLSQKPFEFKNKFYLIKYEIPPNPIIRKV